VQIYATGSNARLLSRDVVTEFRGRGQEIAMHPLSFREYFEGLSQAGGTPGAQAGAVQGAATAAPAAQAAAPNRRDAYEEYALYGGLPAVTQYARPEAKTTFLKQLFAETYLRDIEERYTVKSPGDLEEILDVLCSNIGCLTNASKIANTIASKKGAAAAPSRQTVETYLGYLEDAFLFERARRYDIKGRAYIAAGAKYYAQDLGLCNARMNFRQYEPAHILENVIYNELVIRGYSVDVGVVPARRPRATGAPQRVQYEVDFVCNKASQRIYVQSAFAMPTQEKLEQEQASLTRIQDYFKRIIITHDGPAPHYLDNGILIMNVFDFLLNPRSLEF
jgi:hypothetical protein